MMTNRRDLADLQEAGRLEKLPVMEGIHWLEPLSLQEMRVTELLVTKIRRPAKVLKACLRVHFSHRTAIRTLMMELWKGKRKFGGDQTPSTRNYPSHLDGVRLFKTTSHILLPLSFQGIQTLNEQHIASLYQQTIVI